MMVILVRSPNNREYWFSTGHLLSPNEASTNGTRLHPMSCWPTGTHGNSQTSQVVDETMSCSPQTNSGAPLPGIKATHWTWRSWAGGYMESSSLQSGLCGVEGILQATERETWTLTQPQKFWPTSAFKTCQDNGRTHLVGAANWSLIQLQALSTRELGLLCDQKPETR
jgi:hypothetical protein